ncbi:MULTISPECIES: hypothetical protein [Streptomyces]|uniref:hypothetical protein n=1 Tax=Streptomyces TaxID=1883 RepID=UPI000B11E612|nr:hypothetical protein [Streptomyces virginiae]
MTIKLHIGREFILRHSAVPFDWFEKLGADGNLIALADRLVALQYTLQDATNEPTASSCSSMADKAEQARDEQDPRGANSRFAREDAKTLNELLQRYLQAFEEADVEASKQLQLIIAAPEISGAVSSSTPDVYTNANIPFTGNATPLSSFWRRIRLQTYMHLERLCTRNEMVSYGHPLGYGSIDTGSESRLHHAGVPRKPRAFLLPWAGRILASALARDPEILPSLSFRSTKDVECQAGPLLSLVTAQEISFQELKKLSGLPDHQMRQELGRLLDARLLTTPLLEAVAGPDPLRSLRAELALLPHSSASRRWAGQLSDLMDALVELPELDFVTRTAAIAAAERQFASIAQRCDPAVTYDHRAIGFEETGSPFSLCIGADLILGWERQLAPALEAILRRRPARRVTGSERERTVVGTPDRVGPASQASFGDAGTGGSHNSRSAGDGVAAPEDPSQRPHQDCMPARDYAVIDIHPAAPDVALLQRARLVLPHVFVAEPDGTGSLCRSEQEAAPGAGSRAQWMHSPIRPAQPEVVMGNVVLQRKGWTASLNYLAALPPSERFLALRKLASQTGCRFVVAADENFASSGGYLIDLASPLAADLIGHLARGVGEVRVACMDPGPSELWLRDRDGRRYTSELSLQIAGEEEQS